MPYRCAFTCLLALAACDRSEDLVLPDDPSEPGMPVGVRTFEDAGQRFEVWYPATDDVDGATDVVDLAEFVPEPFADRTPEITVPTIPTPAWRDAPPRALDDPLPVVLFSHGFGGFRTQSFSLTAHLASRGYVVVSADHPGRMLTDVLPCLLVPPAGPCALFGGGDPAVDDLAAVLAWVKRTPDVLATLADPTRVGLFGHSAGGVSTTTFASTDETIDAALPMAGAGTFSRALPSAVIGGSCDAIVPESALLDAGATASEGYFSLRDAGHLAFSDLCDADLGAVAETLADRDDVNSLVLAQLGTLAVDGCPGASPQVTSDTCGEAWLDPAVAARSLRGAMTVFFDLHLSQRGPGLEGLSFPSLEQVRPE